MGLAQLDDVSLKLQYPPSKLYDEGYFEHYEQTLDWYFDTELWEHAHFDHYQRLVLRGYVSLNTFFDSSISAIFLTMLLQGRFAFTRQHILLCRVSI